jgi:hypothetical protein
VADSDKEDASRLTARTGQIRTCISDPSPSNYPRCLPHAQPCQGQDPQFWQLKGVVHTPGPQVANGLGWAGLGWLWVEAAAWMMPSFLTYRDTNHPQAAPHFPPPWWKSSYQDSMGTVYTGWRRASTVGGQDGGGPCIRLLSRCIHVRAHLKMLWGTEVHPEPRVGHELWASHHQSLNCEVGTLSS